MTLAPDRPAQPEQLELVTVTVDGFEVRVPKGTLIIRAAEQLGVQIPRFCDHPLLDPIGACRQCLVEVEGQRKPVASCTATVADGMVIKTQLTSPVADKAQQGTMELLLINHPLDCPVCDKGGECPLQNQALTNGRADSRYRDVKRTYPKPIAISSQVLLDRERCVLCARCTRFSEQVAGDPFIELFERGALEQVAVYEDEPFESYFSGNTVQICPVGALTSAAYRFRARPFDLMSTPGVCEHCASGCALRTDWRRGKVMRRLAAEDPAVNEEWNCDKGRFAFTYVNQTDRLTVPLVRDERSGQLVATSWTEALERAAEGLREARDSGGVGVLPGGRLTLEDAYAYAKFARLALETNDVDSRSRVIGAASEELDFLAARVAGIGPETGAVTYGELEAAPSVLLVGFEPEEESPIVFLRLRKAARKRGQRLFSIAPWLTNGVRKAFGTLLATVPGDEPRVLRALAVPARAGDAPVTALPAEAPAQTVAGAMAAGRPGPVAASAADAVRAAADALREHGAVILVGERAAEVPGLLTAVAGLATATGARLAWVPRRAGERSAIDAGAVPTLLPGGRRVADDAGRAEVEAVWGRLLPTTPGRDVAGIVAAAAAGELSALVIGGVDVNDLPDPRAARAALDRVGFVVSLEIRRSSVTEHADVVLPVAPVLEKPGTFVDWEGRPRPFVATLRATGALTDSRVLHVLADEMDVDLGLPAVDAVRAELRLVGTTGRPRPADPSVTAPGPATAGRGQAVLATWRQLLDRGSLQDGEPHLAGTAREPVAVVSAGTAAGLGLTDGAKLTVRTGQGAVTLPARLAPMPDGVVWLPANSPGSAVRRTLGVGAGAVVEISGGAA
ncbi:MAG TPA: NADH-quinone oxidoreductase subunit G [Actinoplanes sp.]|nr:NADH-quinone oxidoreductase subunit G [Actinoplanes sp.]